MGCRARDSLRPSRHDGPDTQTNDFLFFVHYCTDYGKVKVVCYANTSSLYSKCRPLSSHGHDNIAHTDSARIRRRRTERNFFPQWMLPMFHCYARHHAAAAASGRVGAAEQALFKFSNATHTPRTCTVSKIHPHALPVHAICRCAAVGYSDADGPASVDCHFSDVPSNDLAGRNDGSARDWFHHVVQVRRLP